ncbi:hypothetical protein [Bacillus salipaludis]|uniref:Fur-regulated basic protein FbpA n=1 Tax=Bacillus salipaludis TaxID=2547811 RepID=A0ABW8RBB5_9BACI
MTGLKLINTYKSELQNYSLEQLRYLPEEGVWSIGQSQKDELEQRFVK